MRGRCWGQNPLLCGCAPDSAWCLPRATLRPEQQGGAPRRGEGLLAARSCSPAPRDVDTARSESTAHACPRARTHVAHPPQQPWGVQHFRSRPAEQPSVSPWQAGQRGRVRLGPLEERPTLHRRLEDTGRDIASLFLHQSPRLGSHRGSSPPRQWVDI